jgi:hypothetical protein
MTTKDKGRTPRQDTAPKTTDSPNFTTFYPSIGDSYPSRIKTLIVRLALAGWLPVPLADFLIRHGGLRHV